MSKRKCDICGELKDVYKGGICEENSHFICKYCFKSRKCPICSSYVKG